MGARRLGIEFQCSAERLNGLRVFLGPPLILSQHYVKLGSLICQSQSLLECGCSSFEIALLFQQLAQVDTSVHVLWIQLKDGQKMVDGCPVVFLSLERQYHRKGKARLGEIRLEPDGVF